MEPVTKPRTDVRPTISLAPEIWAIAERQMRLKGFNNNISQYIRSLIWADKEETENRAMALRETPTRYGRRKPSSASQADTQRKIAAALQRDLSKTGAASRPKRKP